MTKTEKVVAGILGLAVLVVCTVLSDDVQKATKPYINRLSKLIS